MAYNKVDADGKTLIDLTSDTVTADTLVSGRTAHLASGERVAGTFEPVTGVKGNAESTYRKGDVNLTPANIGAATAEQGTKADSAVQTIQIGGTVQTKTDGTVNLPAYPTIPTVNDGTLTIRQNGTTKATFTANQAGNAMVNIETGDAYGIDMYDDTLPIDITARGDNLEDWVIYGNNGGVGQKTKNKVNTEGYDSKSNVVEITDIDTETGSIKATVLTSGSYASINYDTGLALENGKTYVFSCVVNVANPAAGLRIRNHNPASIQNSLMFNSTGYKEATFTISDDKYPTGAFLSVMITDSTTTTGSIDISNLMVREANTESGFVPYGYELPIITKQTGKADITTNIYLGTSPLTEGQSLSKAQATTKDIPTYNGECTIDTTYPNKPRIEIIPTDSAINIINGINEIKSDMRGVTQDLDKISEELDCLIIQAALVNNEVIIQNTSDFTRELYSKYFSYTKPKFAILKLQTTPNTYYYKALLNSLSSGSGILMEASFITVANGEYIYNFTWALSDTLEAPRVTRKALNLGS